MHDDFKQGFGMPSANISSINELAAISSSLTNHVDEVKRKQLVCVHWIK